MFGIVAMFGIGMVELLILMATFAVPVIITVVVLITVLARKGQHPAHPNLQPCPDCQRPVSMRAQMCPHCGAPLKPRG